MCLLLWIEEGRRHISPLACQLVPKWVGGIFGLQSQLWPPQQRLAAEKTRNHRDDTARYIYIVKWMKSKQLIV